ncbi:DEAD-box ATP-dependent RNA helicase 17 [Auxenochlorella protothecoides]|uniref:ATP-dependent RNA helicase n=1 Tax=Auxenochlorella protothecoides TaxID=3075 RepID=A0A087SDC7_AUXPR|nr:DEAD-box ATP-dependent RNA helicase 17 [Auxenochlorella protothecoides]KFM23731.1 DEAD-box ATP-dependent RNA helicase 17 [Auxenochlorella protothecoides]
MRAASKKAGEREATPAPGAAGWSEDEGATSSDDELYTNLRAAAGVGAPGQSRRPKRPKVKQASREESAGAGLRPGELARAAVARTRPGRPCVGMGQADAEPADGFAGLGLAPELAQHLGSLGFAVPTPVQAACIPALLDGQDVLANAPTGSGKTLAYLAPIVSELARRAQRVTREQGTLALVVCPTRELALQVENVLGALLRRFFWLVGSSVHGGESRSREKARLRKGVHVLVATPGRLLDHLQNTEAFRVDALAWLVLDEADRLLDLGFGKKIAEILGLLDERRDGAQTLRRVTALFSATLHSGVERLAGLSLRKPMHIGLEDSTATGHSAVPGSPAEDAAAPLVPGAANGAAQVQQYVIPPQLRQFYVEFYHAVLHGAWQEAVGQLQSDDPLDALPVLKLHGDMDQASRTKAFAAFMRSPRGVLLCTDVAARGLDFPGVTATLQPGEAGYVGRLAERGVRLAALDATRLLDGALGLDRRAGKLARDERGLPLERHQGAYALQRRLMGVVAADAALTALAAAAFRSWVRAYAAHPAAVKDIFHVKRLHLGHVAHSFALT